MMTRVSKKDIRHYCYQLNDKYLYSVQSLIGFRFPPELKLFFLYRLFFYRLFLLGFIHLEFI